MIRTIMCCCGNGVGTSLLMQMTIEEALEELNREDIEVGFGPVSNILLNKADLYVVSTEYAKEYAEYPVLGLEDLADSELAAELLKPLLEGEGI